MLSTSSIHPLMITCRSKNLTASCRPSSLPRDANSMFKTVSKANQRQHCSWRSDALNQSTRMVFSSSSGTTGCGVSNLRDLWRDPPTLNHHDNFVFWDQQLLWLFYFPFKHLWHRLTHAMTPRKILLKWSSIVEPIRNSTNGIGIRIMPIG